jgi:outer membrane protein OmpA-like peptidoglycan-associated protein
MALTQRGVERNQITALGKGENFPIAGNETAAGRQSNRRVELIFTEGQARIAADPGP